MTKLKMIGLTISTFGVLGLACASVPAPREELTNSVASVEAAEAVDASKVPKAKLHLKMARDQIDEAKKLMEDEEYEEAKRLLEQAKLDAVLAKKLAKAESTREEAQEAEQRLEGLRNEVM